MPVEIHATFEGGRFGAGAGQEYGLMGRFDAKPLRHFGVTAGSSFPHLGFSDTRLNREFKVRQSGQSAVVGVGLYS